MKIQLKTASLALTALLTAGAPLALGQADGMKGEAAKGEKQAGGEIVMSPKLAKGQTMKFKYRMERTETMTLTGAPDGSKPSLAVTMDADVDATVMDVSDAGATLELVYRVVKANGKNTSGTEYVFDSTKPEDDKDKENAAFTAFKPAVGMKLTLVLGANGAVSEVQGDPIAPTGPFGPAAVQTLVNKDYTKFRWGGALSVKRDGGAMKTGDTWTQSDTFTAPPVGKLEHTFKHTLKSVKGDTASIDSVGDMALHPLTEGDKLAFKLVDASLLSTSTWDIADGISRTFEMQRDFTLDGEAQGMPVKRTVQEKVSITRAK